MVKTNLDREVIKEPYFNSTPMTVINLDGLRESLEKIS